MPLGRFCLFTALGAGAWNAVFIYAGSVAGDSYDRIGSYVQPVSYAVVIILVLLAVALVVRTIRRKRLLALLE